MKNLKSILFITLFFLFGNTFSQTKWIFHKSHSGNNATLIMDENNNFGPGMAPIRYRTPVSKIKLKYINSVSRHNFTVVVLDTSKKTMLFFDTKDSLIGCSRDYREYLKEGAIVYNLNTNSLFIYQAFGYSGLKLVPFKRFLPISDSVIFGLQKKDIRSINSHILDGKNHRIKVVYTFLNWRLARKLILPTFEEIHKGVIPTKVNTRKIRRETKRLQKEEKKQLKLEQEEELTSPEVEENIEEENLIPIFVSNNFTSKPPGKMPLFILGFLVLFTLVFWLKKVLKPTVLKA